MDMATRIGEQQAYEFCQLFLATLQERPENMIFENLEGVLYRSLPRWEGKKQIVIHISLQGLGVRLAHKPPLTGNLVKMLINRAWANPFFGPIWQRM